MASSIPRSDNSLVVALREGDEEAASILYARYAQRVLVLIGKEMGEKLRAKTDPEDIAQSVFKSMFRGVLAGQYNAPAQSSLWKLIALISVNKLRDYGKRFSRQCRDASIEVNWEDAGVPPSQAKLSQESFEQAIRETLEILRPFDRQIVDLRLQGHSIAEISQQVDASRRRVERSLHASRSRLAALLIDGDAAETS